MTILKEIDTKCKLWRLWQNAITSVVPTQEARSSARAAGLAPISTV